MSKSVGRKSTAILLGMVLLSLSSMLGGCRRTITPAPATPGATAAPAQAVMEDVTAKTGIDFVYRNGQEANHFSILESLGGGAGLIDYDRDGKLDIFLPGGGHYDGPDKKQIKGHPCRLYRNLGNWQFEDVTARVGLDRLLAYSHGCAVADYDNDGFPDLLVTGWGRLALFHNESDGKGGRRLVEVSKEAGLTDTLWSTSAAFADLDGDGYPDLYVCHYVDWSWENNPACKDYRGTGQQDVCPPKSFSGLPHTLYLNNGNGTFRDASKAAGLRVPREAKDYASLSHLSADQIKDLKAQEAQKEFGKGLGVLIVDVNNDGRPDIYVANDTVDNFLYLNKGKALFEEVGLISNVARDDLGKPNGSMGVDAADYDGSGHFSIFVTNYQHEAHALYRNLADQGFSYASKMAGIAGIGMIYVGFGTGFIDYDHDGAEDIVIANGHVVRLPPPPGELQQRPIILRNGRLPGMKASQIRFENVTDEAGPYFQGKHIGRGLALGDLDNDGKTDLVISHLNEPVVVLRNVFESSNHWIGIELEGKPDRDAVGARLTLELPEQKLHRCVKGGGSYLSANDKRVLFGLGKNATPGRLSVRWPSGTEQAWSGLKADRYYKIREGEAQAEEKR